MAMDTEPSGNILEQIVAQGHLARSEEQEAYAKDLIGEFSSRVLKDENLSQKDVATLINEQIAELDDLISAQLNEILHHEEFQKNGGRVVRIEPFGHEYRNLNAFENTSAACDKRRTTKRFGQSGRVRPVQSVQKGL